MAGYKKENKLVSVSPSKVAAATAFQLVAAMWDRGQGAAGPPSLPKKLECQNFHQCVNISSKGPLLFSLASGRQGLYTTGNSFLVSLT